MGPERGVKWRGGAPPAPPKWSYEKEDLRAFAKYERKVRLWEIQVEPYMSKREASLQLYNALSGEPEQELEHAPLERINSSQGINYILEQLRGPMSQRLVYQKRRFLSDFENINRFPGEHLRAYVNRYRRTERNLQAVDINVTAMYDGDARGSRLLDRARLSPQDQRLVLVGARYSLVFEDISESLVMQFPDFKPAPPVMSKDGQLITRPKGAGKSNDRASPRQGASGHQGGKGGGKFGPRKVFVAEAAEHAENTIQDDEATSVEQAEEQPDQDEQNHDEQDDLIQVLTVTARRLASVKLGRKYSGNKTSPAELKKTTTCAACGEVGHWRGDDVCKVSGKGASSATSSSQPSASARKTHFKEMPAPKSKPHQTFTVMHSDLGSYELHSGYGTAFEDPDAYQINVVFNTQEVPFSQSFVGYMVLDTACQRTCCGRTWAYNHGKLIAESGLQPIKAERRDTFQFGKGDPIVADCRMYMPAALENGNVFYVGAGVLDAEVPLLASNPFLKALGVVLDLNRMVVHFERLSAHVPVLNLGGHLAVNIACLDSQTAARLSELEHVVDWQRPAPELLIEQLDSLPEGDACHTPAMAATVEVHHDIADPLQAGPLPHDVPSSSSPRVGLGMDDHRNSSSAGPGLRDQPGPLRPQRHLPLRQRHRQVRKVPQVPDKMEVEGRRSKMGASPLQRIFALIGTAVALLGQYGASGATNFEEFAAGGHSQDETLFGGATFPEYRLDDYDDGTIGTQIESESHAGGRHPGVGPARLGKLKGARRLLGNIGQSARILEKEVDVYHALPTALSCLSCSQVKPDLRQRHTATGSTHANPLTLPTAGTLIKRRCKTTSVQW